VASKQSRKSAPAKKPASAAAVKTKPAKAAVVSAAVVAKAKAPARTVAVALPKASIKSNGSASPRLIQGRPATVSAKGAPAKASAAFKAAAAVKVAAPVKAAAPVKVSAKAKFESRKPELPAMPPRPIPEAVPTNGKPRKNQAGLSPRELEHFRDLLLEKRRELVGDMYSMESEALRSSGSNLSNLPVHMADMGTDNYEQEFTLGLVEKDRGLLREINAALAKIQNGTYGICEGTNKPINKVRLEAQPWAKHSIEYARQMQRPMGMGRVG
jgi:RNA polymerase-binding protein DksA